MKTVLMILAAGSSSRMGQSKQLLKIGNVSLLVHTIRTAHQTGTECVIVVLGADEEKHRKAIEDLGVEIVSNPNWRNGMGSSIKAGLKRALKIYPAVESIMILVCDQPLLTADHLKKIMTHHQESAMPIIASGYAGAAGVPALFDKALFPEITSLSDEGGAKKIIQQHLAETVLIAFPGGATDLDTPEDYRKFLMRNS